MGTKIFGIIASAAIVAVIALSLINFGNYRSLLPERSVAVEQAAEQVEESSAIVVADTTAVETADTLALDTVADTLQTE